VTNDNAALEGVIFRESRSGTQPVVQPHFNISVVVFAVHPDLDGEASSAAILGNAAKRSSSCVVPYREGAIRS
jgi:hypothetical protein